MNKWLEKYSNGDIVQQNYNDVSVSLPEGFVGMGYNTKGRNYSPAWGGQFEEGGFLPKAQIGKIVVTNPNDPRLKAYNDSLTLHNASNDAMKMVDMLNYKRNGQERIAYENWRQIANSKIIDKPKVTKAYQSLTKLNSKSPTGAIKAIPTYDGDKFIDNSYVTQFKKPVQPYILQKEPSLKKKVTKAELLKSDRTAFTPRLVGQQRPDVQLPTIQNLPYRVEYYDGDINGMTHKNFVDEKAGSEFMKELQNRSYGIPYGVQSYYENTPKKENGGWLEKYQGGGEEPLTKSSADWYKQWYEQRKTLPQFSRVAGERLNLLSTLPKVQLTPLEELYKRHSVAEYTKTPGDDASQDIISLADPTTVQAFAKKIGKSVDVNIGTDPSVVGHEIGHWLGTRAKQSIFKPRGISKSEPYQRYPYIKPSSFKKSGLSSEDYKWISSEDASKFGPGIKPEPDAVLNELRKIEGLKGDQLSTPEQWQKYIDKYMNLPESELDGTTPKGSQNKRIQIYFNYMDKDAKKLSKKDNESVAIQKEDVPIAKHGGWLNKFDEGGEISPNCDTNALYHPITNPCGYKLKLTPGLLGNTTQQTTQPYNSSNFREQPLANSNSYIQQQQLQKINNTKRVEDNYLKNKILNQPQLKQAKRETPYERERRTALNSSYVGSNQYAALDDDGNITNRIPGIDITGKVYDSKAVRQERMKPLIAAGAIAAGATALPAVVSAATPYVAATSAALNAPLLGTLGAEYGSAALTTNNLINAYFAYEGIKNIPKVVDDWKEVGKSPTLDNVGNATSSTLLSALGILPFTSGVIKGIPSVIQDFNQAGKYLTEETALKNAYKINPWAFKPNPEAYYRGIGKQGAEDALKTGVFRQAGVESGTPNFQKVWYATGDKGFERASAFSDGYVAQVPKTSFSDLDFLKNSMGVETRATSKHIPISEGNILKKDWLQGWKKEVPKPTSISSVAENVGKDVIDFNKDFGVAPMEYFSEYDKGVVASKKFMDKSQDVFENLKSKHKEEFEKLYGTDYNEKDLLNYAKKKEQYFHPSETPLFSEKFSRLNNEFVEKFNPADIESINEKNALQAYTSGSYRGFNFRPNTDANKTVLSLFGEHNPKFYKDEMSPSLQSAILKNKLNQHLALYRGIGDESVIPKVWRNNELLENIKFKDLIEGDEMLHEPFVSTSLFPNPHFGGLSSGTARIVAPKGQSYAFANKQGLSYTPSELELTLPQNLRFKITKKHDADKAFSLGYGVEQEIVNPYKEGGVIKDDMGYWNPENHGKVVEIDSPYITMEGVDQPLIGISDEGDQKYMLPGKNYKFKGKKVREYPVAKNGVRQEQKGLQNLDDLLNFTNYNKPQPGSWLEKYN